MKIHGSTKRIRCIAAIVLMAWVGALLLCSAEPWLGHDHSHDSDDHHPEAESASHGHDSDDPPDKAPHEGGFCSALKSTILSSAHVVLIKPKVECIGVLSSAFLVPDSAIQLFDTLVLRHAKRPVSVITHEVCTSPANRSLAPPA
jgi:hypothetical protein